MRLQWIMIGLLSLAVLVSALGVVESRHQSRKLFVELQQLERTRDDLEIEWGRLQLEQAAWATHGRIERIARERLGMHLPRADETTVIGP
ncbi:MAG: cell division protein FtsL [Gammaproteobacteria bacterium]|nr:MAG: cell division protein FtsL [Gammaproteobacteria bacterium]